jgi:hypothetical protein
MALLDSHYSLCTFPYARCRQPRRKAAMPQFERGHYVASYHQAERVVFAAARRRGSAISGENGS